MSNSLAVAAVTATLRTLIDTGVNADVAGTTVTVQTPDNARSDGATGNQVNLFLYHTRPAPAWRNMDVPWRVKPGETGHAPLPLDLYYLVTAYGQNDDDTFAHRLLGRAMSVLHDHPILGADEIRAATETQLPGSDLHEQVEHVRITLQPLSLDELTKLWNAFQTRYRLSTAYEVSVVLIESTRPARTPLPVLMRGEDDRGVTAQADLIPPFPTMERVDPPDDQPAARLGDVVVISGHHLGGDSVEVRFTHPRLDDPLILAPLAGATATSLSVEVPDAPADWPAGVYSLAVVVSTAGEPERTSNAVPLPLAPRILTITPDPATPDAAGDVTLTVTCSPEVLEGQPVALLLGDREIPAQPFATDPTDPAERTDTLTFVVEDAPAGDHFVRLRVDGVDSLLVDRSVTPPVFDTTQRVTIS